MGGGSGGGGGMDLASAAMSWMAMYALLERLLPPPLRELLDHKLNALWQWLLNHNSSGLVRLKVPERSSEGCINHFYRHSLAFLSSLEPALSSHNSLTVLLPEEEGRIFLGLPSGVPFEHAFRGVVVKWQRQMEDKEEEDSGAGAIGRPRADEYLTLEFPVAGRPVIMPAYLEHISRTAIQFRHRNTQLNLYRNDGFGSWDPVPFTHPSTFDSLALDTHLRRQILDDLDHFCNGQQQFHRLGRAWKRGYLLHGPPGTGKTSLIAAIANRLHYHIYDLELTCIADNADLKWLLMNTARKSIVVIEDIDCSLNFEDRGEGRGQGQAGTVSAADASKAPDPPRSRLTLSGLLNFTDGLWSGCAEERIFIFTTNFKERLDAALLRPGRMDMHIHLSYCTLSVVEKLVEKHLSGVSSGTHPELFARLEKAVRAQHTVTPAAVAEIFMGNKGNPPDMALEAAIEAFEKSNTDIKSRAS